MTKMNQEDALQALLDKEAIRELVQIYCRASDRHDHELMRSLYHEDATDDHGSFFKGLAMEFIDQLPEIQAPMEILHHNVTTHNIELNGDRAEGETYVLAFHKVKTDTGAFDLLIGGRYFDTYEKRNGVWKFSSSAVSASRQLAPYSNQQSGQNSPDRFQVLAGPDFFIRRNQRNRQFSSGGDDHAVRRVSVKLTRQHG